MYAQNIDLHLHAADGASGETPGKIYNFNILEVLFSNFPCRFLNPTYVSIHWKNFNSNWKK